MLYIKRKKETNKENISTMSQGCVLETGPNRSLRVTYHPFHENVPLL